MTKQPIKVLAFLHVAFEIRPRAPTNVGKAVIVHGLVADTIQAGFQMFDAVFRQRVDLPPNLDGLLSANGQALFEGGFGPGSPKAVEFGFCGDWRGRPDRPA